MLSLKTKLGRSLKATTIITYSTRYYIMPSIYAYNIRWDKYGIENASVHEYTQMTAASRL